MNSSTYKAPRGIKKNRHIFIICTKRYIRSLVTLLPFACVMVTMGKSYNMLLA